jgi:hypothetical protein
MASYMRASAARSDAASSVERAEPHFYTAPRVGLDGGFSDDGNAAPLQRDVAALHAGLADLERLHVADARRRTEAHDALHHLVELRVKEVADALERRTQDRLVQLTRAVDVLTSRVHSLETALAAEREKNARLAAELQGNAGRALADVRQQLDTDRRRREEALGEMQRRFGGDLSAVEDQLAVLQRAREDTTLRVQEAIDRAAQRVAQDEDAVLKFLVQETKRLAGCIDDAAARRDEDEESLAAALADMAQQMQHLGVSRK